MNDQFSDYIIETENLCLLPCESKLLGAIARDKRELEPILNVKVPDSWPVFPDSIPHLYALSKSLSTSKDPSSLQWGYYLFIHARDRVLMGEGGYKGTPDEEGVVEIGYAIVPEYRNRGLAKEAATALLNRAFSCPQVKSVQAHTLKDGMVSIKLLEKLGMNFVGTAQDPDEGEVLQWRVVREDWKIADLGLRIAD